jgi:hypothetical protein
MSRFSTGSLPLARRRSARPSSILLVVGCAGNPSGLTKAEAEFALHKNGYEHPAIGGSPAGWSGTADRGGGSRTEIV